MRAYVRQDASRAHVHVEVPRRQFRCCVHFILLMPRVDEMRRCDSRAMATPMMPHSCAAQTVFHRLARADVAMPRRLRECRIERRSSLAAQRGAAAESAADARLKMAFRA